MKDYFINVNGKRINLLNVKAPIKFGASYEILKSSTDEDGKHMINEIHYYFRKHQLKEATEKLAFLKQDLKDILPILNVFFEKPGKVGEARELLGYNDDYNCQKTIDAMKKYAEYELLVKIIDSIKKTGKCDFVIKRS